MTSEYKGFYTHQVYRQCRPPPNNSCSTIKRLPTNHHGDKEESEHKITRALLAYVETLIKHSNNWSFATLTFKDCTILYSNLPPFLPYHFHLTCGTSHFQSSLLLLLLPTSPHQETQNHEHETVKAINMKSKRYLY